MLTFVFFYIQVTSTEISGSFTVNTCIVHYRHQEFSHWLNLFPWEQLLHRKTAHRKRQVFKTIVVRKPPLFFRSPTAMKLIIKSPFFVIVSPTFVFCTSHSVLCFSMCSLLDYLPTLLSLRRLPHLDAPVMITTSVSNINVSVQLGDTTPFALGFLSASGGTVGLLHSFTHTNKRRGR